MGEVRPVAPKRLSRLWVAVFALALPGSAASQSAALEPGLKLREFVAAAASYCGPESFAPLLPSGNRFDQPGADNLASALYFCALAAADAGEVGRASVLLRYARNVGGQRSLWKLRNGQWRRERADLATGREYSRLNGTRLTYRFLSAAAGWGPQRLGLIQGLLLVFLLVRLLEAPVFTYLFTQPRHAWLWLRMFILLEIITLIWAARSADDWRFSFTRSGESSEGLWALVALVVPACYFYALVGAGRAVRLGSCVTLGEIHRRTPKSWKAVLVAPLLGLLVSIVLMFNEQDVSGIQRALRGVEGASDWVSFYFLFISAFSATGIALIAVSAEIAKYLAWRRHPSESPPS